MKQTLTKISVAAGSASTALFLSVSSVLANSSTIDIGTVEGGPGWAANLGSIISTALSFVMALAALIVFMYLIWGGIEWITSGGDKSKTESARNKITAAVLGLIVLAASYAILLLMLQVLGLGSITETFNNVKVIDPATGNM